MDLEQVMKQLEKLGKPATADIYRRHGAPEPLFGVAFSELYKLQKQIKRDQGLAVGLWNTGNSDARTLAVLVADPGAFSAAQLDEWIKECRYYGLIEVFTRSVVAKGPHAKEKAEKWTKSPDEWVSSAGWVTVASLALGNNPAVTDAWFEDKLKTIEKTLAKAPNRTRYEMNGALIAIGGRTDALRDRAIAAAKKIGKVEVDHGETGCKTPDAVEYIAKMWERKKQVTVETAPKGPEPKLQRPKAPAAEERKGPPRPASRKKSARG